MVYDTDGAGMETDTNPYSMQNHLYDKSQPENIEFLKRLRALMDGYDDRTTVGEVGDGPRSLSTLAIYTSGNDKLHMRSEEHTSELQSLMRSSYAVFCLKKNKQINSKPHTEQMHNHTKR